MRASERKRKRARARVRESGEVDREVEEEGERRGECLMRTSNTGHVIHGSRSHVTHMKESCHTYGGGMSHMKESRRGERQGGRQVRAMYVSVASVGKAHPSVLQFCF